MGARPLATRKVSKPLSPDDAERRSRNCRAPIPALPARRERCEHVGADRCVRPGPTRRSAPTSLCVLYVDRLMRARLLLRCPHGRILDPELFEVILVLRRVVVVL